MSSVFAVSRPGRHGVVWLAALVLAGLGCSGAGTGCGGMTPIPGGRYQGPKNDNAVNIRVSGNGINYLNTHWPDLVSTFAPGNTLTIPVSCTKQSFSLSFFGTSDVYIADQGGPSGGRNDRVCDSKDVPANVQATITGFSLVPTAPDKLEVAVSLSINTGKLYVSIDSFCNLYCSVDFNTARHQGGGFHSFNTMSAVMKFSIDTKWDKLLSFSVEQLTGSQICGASGAPASPRCIDPLDLSLSWESGICGAACDVLDIDAVKNFVLGLLSGPLQTQIRTIIGQQTCAQCMATTDCPVSTDGTNTQAVCQNKVCNDPGASGKCAPRFLGVEGRINLGTFLGSFGAPANAQLDLSLAAGASVTVDQGLSFGTRVGIKPVQVASCVPPSAPPAVTAVNAPNFDAEASPGSQYHVGLGLSSNFLNTAFHAAHQAGALCLQLSSQNVGLINTGLFETFLPSLGKLATRDGKDAPMMVVLRPARPPAVTVGLGTYDPVTKKPIKPLLTLTLPELSIDFYAMLDDRYARLFTLTADIALPLSLIFEGCDKVTPAIGDLKMLISNIRTANAEMLAEDPQVLADLVPAIIGLAEPAVAGALKPFSLPTLGAFKLKVNEVKGLSNISGTEQYNHLGLYAQFLGVNDMCAVSAPRLSARLVESRMPKAAEMRATGKQALPWPEAVLEVSAEGKAGSPEYSVRVDDGLWSDFLPATDGKFVVSHPRFLLQGAHTIWIRARVAEDGHGISEPRAIGFRVDWDPPEVTLTANRERDRLEVSAHDTVSGQGALRFAYRVGDGAFSDFGPAREIALSAVEQQGGVTVRVMDELGNVGEATWRAPTVAVRSDVTTPLGAAPTDAPHSGGCAAVDGLSLAGLLALAGLFRRRR